MNRVLILTQDLPTGQNWLQLLGNAGFQTAGVQSASQLIDFCRQHTPDFAVLDVDGASDELWNAVTVVKGLGNLANLPLLGMSSDGDPGTLDRARSVGFLAVFPKKQDFQSVVHSLKSMIEPATATKEQGMTSNVENAASDAVSRLKEISCEVIGLTRTLQNCVAEFGDDGPELFGYIEDSGAAIQAKLESLHPDSLHDKELRHDFRNMIGSVTGFAELIMMEPGVSPDSHENLGRIRQYSQTFVDILDEQKAEANV